MDRLKLLAQLLTVAKRVVPYISPTIGYSICTLLGAIVGPHLKNYRYVLANLQITMPHNTRPEHEAAARRVMIGMFKNYYDLLRFHTLSPDKLQRTTITHGFEHIEQAIERGHGLLIVPPHVGSYTIAFTPLAQCVSTRTLLVVEQLPDPRLHQITNSLRQVPGIDIASLSPNVVRVILRALRSNHAVILAGDRAIAQNAVTVPFFGRPTPIPSGPATLALRTNAPVIPCVTLRLPDNRTLVHFDPPLAFERTTDFKQDVRAATAKIAAIMAAYIRRDPSQWLVAEPVWPDGDTTQIQ